MWFRARANIRTGGRMQTGLAVGAAALGVGAAVLLVRRLIRG